MSTLTSIEWTDAVWNPVTGCTKVSEGCRHCYAEAVAHRFWGARNFTDVQCHVDRLEQPLHWKKPRRIFVNSMSDLFHEDVPDEFIHQVFAVMALCSQHTFQILTKRPERMQALMCDEQDKFFWALVEGNAQRMYSQLNPTVDHDAISMGLAVHSPLPNVWLGVSVDDQKTADERIPILLQTPAAVQWVSVEPLLGPVDLSLYLSYIGQVLSYGGLDWVVVGGESGLGARPCDVAWIRSIVGQCSAAGVPCFVKQLGSRPIYRGRPPFNGANVLHSNGEKLKDKKGGDMAEFPSDLRVREWPR